MNRDKRSNGERGNGQMFSSSPACAIPLLFNTDEALTPGEQEKRASEKGRERESIVEVPPNAALPLGLCTCINLMFNFSQVGGLDYLHAPRITPSARYVDDNIPSISEERESD